MKIKTSITLSGEVLRLIDQYRAAFRSRLKFLERAAKAFLEQLARTESERRDLQIINQHADDLNTEAKDVLAYQVAL